MNAKHFIAAFAVFAATGSAFAEEYVVPDANFASTRTRAEVIAEIEQARADGTLYAIDIEYPIVKETGTPKTRAEVLAELEQARADGSLHVSDASYPVIPEVAVSRSRAEVLAELEQYRKAHPYGDSNSLYTGS